MEYLNKGASIKNGIYKTPLETGGVAFHPIVISSLGLTHSSFDKYVRLCKRTAERNNLNLSLKYFNMRFSHCLAFHAGRVASRSYHNIMC